MLKSYELREAEEKRHMWELHLVAEYKTPRALEFLNAIGAKEMGLPTWFNTSHFVGVIGTQHTKYAVKDDGSIIRWNGVGFGKWEEVEGWGPVEGFNPPKVVPVKY
jgi:hypothetical protein